MRLEVRGSEIGVIQSLFCVAGRLNSRRDVDADSIGHAIGADVSSYRFFWIVFAPYTLSNVKLFGSVLLSAFGSLKKI